MSGAGLRPRKKITGRKERKRKIEPKIYREVEHGWKRKRNLPFVLREMGK